MVATQTPQPPAPAATVSTRRAGLVMARLDAPYPARGADLRIVAVVLLLAALVASVALVVHQASDAAFEEYARTSRDVDLLLLTTDPDQHQGERIHVRGVSAVVLTTDTENQFFLADSASAAGQSGASADPAQGPRVLVRTSEYVPSRQPVDVWGTFVGTDAESESPSGLPVLIIRAEYVHAAD